MIPNFLEALEANAKLPIIASKPLSAASQVRLRLPNIEAALSLGYTHRQILDQLNRDGIDITAAYYHRLIPKLRSETRAGEEGSEGQAPAVEINREGIANSHRPLAQPPIRDRMPVAAQSATNSDDFSVTIAAPTTVKPRTISGRKPDGPKFKWDPKGAENFDPDKL